MNECLICYETQVAVDEMVLLECMHALCKCCYNQLQQQICPFCRTAINHEVKVQNANFNLVNTDIECIYDRNIRVHVRRRRRKTRTAIESFNTEHGNIIVESSERDSRYRQKTKKRKHRDNKKRGNWARQAARNRVKMATCR